LPRQYEIAEVVGKWVWLDVSPSRKPNLVGRWAFIGTSGVVSGSIRAAALTRSVLIPPTRAPSIASIFPPIFWPLEHRTWLTKWLTNQVETEHFNSDTIRLNHL